MTLFKLVHCVHDAWSFKTSCNGIKNNPLRTQSYQECAKAFIDLVYRGRRYGASFLKDVGAKESLVKKIAPSEKSTWFQTLENSAMLCVCASRLADENLQKLDSPDKAILLVSSAIGLYETSTYLYRLIEAKKENSESLENANNDLQAL